MDALSIVLSAPLESVDHVAVTRVLNTADRRKPLQKKGGAGLDVDTFERAIVDRAGHVGSTESIAMLADALGRALTDIPDRIEPVNTEAPVESEFFAVEPGEVAGIRQRATGRVGDDERVSLDRQMALGARARDRIEFESSPPITVTVDGGSHGDVSTSAIVRNVAPRVVDATPGVTSVIDLPMPHYQASSEQGWVATPPSPGRRRSASSLSICGEALIASHR